LNAVYASVLGRGKQEWPGLSDNRAMGGPGLIPVRFHATTIAGEVLRRLIDKKCGGFMKINAAKSTGKGRFRRINQAEMPC
jgi:hypothetical protein